MSYQTKTTFNIRDISDFVNIDYTFLSKYNIVTTINLKNNKGNFIVKNIDTNIIYFAKVYISNMLPPNIIEINELLLNNPHENIIKYIEKIISTNLHYFIYEYIDGIPLCEIKSLNNQNKLNLNQIFEGVKHLHKLNIIHCNINKYNIMITKNNIYKIIDIEYGNIITNDDNVNKSISSYSDSENTNDDENYSNIYDDEKDDESNNSSNNSNNSNKSYKRITKLFISKLFKLKKIKKTIKKNNKNKKINIYTEKKHVGILIFELLYKKKYECKLNIIDILKKICIDIILINNIIEFILL